MRLGKINSKKLAYSIARILAIYGLFCLLLFCIQRSLLFFPSHHSDSGSLKPWQEAGEVIGQCREVASPEAIWLMMHGNAGQASDRDYVLSHIGSTTSLFVLEYPGYGSRPGSPSQQAFNVAAVDAYERLRKKFPNIPIGVIGESIGSGPASMLTQHPTPPNKIILVVPFDTVYNVASRRFFYLPVWLLLLDRWDNIQALEGYSGPVEIYGALHDDVIPFRHAKNLASRHPQARFIELDCGHNDWPAQPDLQFQP